MTLFFAKEVKMSTTELKSRLEVWCARNQGAVEGVAAEDNGLFKIKLKTTERDGNLPFIDVYPGPGNQVVLQKGMYKGSTPGATFIKGPRFLRDENHLDDSLAALLK